MSFLLFERVIVDGEPIMRPTGGMFKLAGYNLIYTAWQRRGGPIDEGWQVLADELVKIATDEAESYSTRRLVIDFDPKATWRIGLKELLGIYAFTWGNGAAGPLWTPLMLKMRDLYYEEYGSPIDSKTKASILANLNEPTSDAPEVVEFLYLNGPRYGWNWGMNGMTNAAFLQGEARDYFRRFF